MHRGKVRHLGRRWLIRTAVGTVVVTIAAAGTAAPKGVKPGKGPVEASKPAGHDSSSPSGGVFSASESANLVAALLAAQQFDRDDNNGRRLGHTIGRGHQEHGRGRGRGHDNHDHAPISPNEPPGPPFDPPGPPPGVPGPPDFLDDDDFPPGRALGRRGR